MAAYDSSQNRIVCSKSLTTYDDLTDGILTTFDKSGVVLAGEGIFKHGTTIVINALLQRSASGIALVTTRGFRDVLEMARGNRPVPFDLFYERSAPLVPRELRYEIDERMDGQGKVLRPPRRDEVDALAGELKALGPVAEIKRPDDGNLEQAFLRLIGWPGASKSASDAGPADRQPTAP